MSANGEPGPRGARISIALVAALAIGSGLLSLRHGVYPFDEGIILYGAHSLCRGERVYEGVRVNYTPGILWTTEALFRLFGEHVLVPRLAMVAVFTALVLTCRSILVALAAPEAAAVTALGLAGLRAYLHPHWTMTSYTPFAVLLFLLALRALLSREPRWIAAGLCAGGAFAYKQNVGAVAMLSVAVAVGLLARPRDWPRVALRSAAAGLAPVAAMLLWIAATGDLARFWKDGVRDNTTAFSAYWNVPYPVLRPSGEIREEAFFYVPGRVFGFLYARPAVFARALPFVPIAVRLVYAVPVLAVALLAIRGLRGGAPARRELLLAIAAGLLLLLAWPLATILHWATASLGALLCAAVLCARTRARAAVYAVTVGLAAAGGLAFEVAGIANERSPVSFPAGTLYTNAGTATHVGSLLRYLREHVPPDARLLVVPYAPFYYLASGHENPIADDYLIPPWTDEARTADIARELSEKDVQFVLWSHGELPRIQRFAEYARPLAEEIRRSYRIVYRSEGGAPRAEIWERRTATVTGSDAGRRSP
ncbi:MAG: hypothetical protein U0166_02255 [Acidobacteriota bacterium]